METRGKNDNQVQSSLENRYSPYRHGRRTPEKGWLFAILSPPHAHTSVSPKSWKTRPTIKLGYNDEVNTLDGVAAAALACQSFKNVLDQI